MQRQYPSKIAVPGEYAPGMAAGGLWRMPLFQAAYDPMAEERQIYQDAKRMQSYYPKTAKQIQEQVEEACDKMEYEGSMMFDEHPDRLMMRRTVQSIAEKIKERNPGEWEGDQEEALAGQSGRPAGPRQGRGGWLEDLVQVMLADEMYRRRCRHRRCQRRMIW